MVPTPEDPHQTICFCHDVSRGRILEVIRKKIAETGDCALIDIQTETAASTGCGGCESDCLEILEQAKQIR